MSPMTGDKYADRDSMTLILSKFVDAYSDWDITPGPDEASELSSWTQEVFKFASRLEDLYGGQAAQAIMQSAWQEARQK